MPYSYTRICPICQKVGVQNIFRHLGQAHRLPPGERKSYLESRLYQIDNGNNVHTNNRKNLLDKMKGKNYYTKNVYTRQILLNESKILQPAQANEELSNELVKERPSKNSINYNAGMCNETVKENPSKHKTVMEKNRIDHTWNAHSYTGFQFKHPFSMLVVGPTS